jgi:hypothetical protein
VVPAYSEAPFLRMFSIEVRIVMDNAGWLQEGRKIGVMGL